ncbi:MAG: SAM-dependent methyltransferase [Nitrososphaera sp.]|uniref:SAM-dependent methyltransferase n=1 Tax=Nitrososphaera sp. TaxID=1971748 RepID=UPI003D6EBEC0
MNIDEFLSTLPENVVKGREVELADGVVKKMFKLAGLRKGDVFYHLGCRQGNAVKIAAKEFGVKKAVGIELDEKLAAKARKKVAGIKSAAIEQGDMLKADISPATVVMFWFSDPATVDAMVKKLRTLKDGARVVTVWSPPGMMMPDKVEFPFFVCKKPFKRARSVRQQIKAVYGTECIDFTASWLLAERYIDALEVVPGEYRRFVNMLQSMVIWINAWNMGISCEDGVPPPVQTYLGILREFFGLDLSDMFTRAPKDESMVPPAGMNC